MNTRSLVMALGLWAVLAAFACDGGDGDADSHADASDRSSGRSHDAGATPAPATSDLPLLCPSCDPHSMPGGDTTDFGGASHAPCDGSSDRRFLTLEQVEREGLELDAELDRAEGEHEFSVRWDEMTAQQTTLVVRIQRTGRARVDSWVTDSPNESPRSWLDRDCPEEWTIVLPEVEVQLSTADDSLTGKFTGWLESRTRPVFYPGSFEWERADPWWQVAGDGASLRGRLQFAGSGQPEALEVSVSALYGENEQVRAGATLRWLWFDREGLKNDSGGWMPLEPARSARPLDGCMPFEHAVDPKACNPWSEPGCCTQLGRRVDYEWPEGIDAGALGDAG